MGKKIGNKGFTLIELLLVMVISVLILAMIMLSYNVVNNANATKAARRLETVIRTARTTTMAKGMEAGKLTLTVEHGNLYAQIGPDGNKDLICNSGVTVKGLYCDSTLGYGSRSGADFDKAIIVFNTSGTVRTKGVDADHKTQYNKFLLNRGNRSFEVILYAETGALKTTMY